MISARKGAFTIISTKSNSFHRKLWSFLVDIGTMILEKMRKIWKVDIDDNDDEIWTTDNGQWLSWTKTLTFAAQGLSPFWVQRVWYHILRTQNGLSPCALLQKSLIKHTLTVINEIAYVFWDIWCINNLWWARCNFD